MSQDVYSATDAFFKDLVKDNPFECHLNQHRRSDMFLERYFFQAKGSKIWDDCLATRCAWETPHISKSYSAKHLWVKDNPQDGKFFTSSSFSSFFDKEKLNPDVLSFVQALDLVCSSIFKENPKNNVDNYSLWFDVLPSKSFFDKEKQKIILDNHEFSNLSEEEFAQASVLFITRHYINRRGFYIHYATSSQEFLKTMIGFGLDEQILDPNVVSSLPHDFRLILLEHVHNHSWENCEGDAKPYQEKWNEQLSLVLESHLPQHELSSYKKKM